MGNKKVEDALVNSIKIMVDRAIDQAEFDKTIQATILQCTDATTGTYKVSYQNSIFYATTGNSNTKYSKGTTVYILIPGNDLSSKEKHIIGSVKKLGTQYISVPEGDEAYTYTGNNRITFMRNKNIDKISLCSLKPLKLTPIYIAGDTKKSLLSINQTLLKKDILESNHIIFGGKVQTQIPIDNQMNGNYGLVLTAEFYRRNSKGTDEKRPTYTQTFVFDINKMTGMPYNYSIPVRQYGIYEVDGKNFKRVTQIQMFCENFPHQNENADDDIFFKNIELAGVQSLSKEELQGSTLIIEPGRAEFDSNTTTLTLKATVKVKGKPASSEQDIKYYWFKENATVFNGSDLYCEYGGNGWECLNKKRKVKQNNNEWIPETNTLIINRDDAAAAQIKYMCIAISDETTLKREKVVYNSGNVNITITTDSGTVFYYGTGEPTLTCNVDNSEKEYSYEWIIEKQDGTIERLVEQDQKNDLKIATQEYKNITDQIANLQTSLKNNTEKKTSGEEKLKKLQEDLEKKSNEIQNLTRKDAPCVVVENKLMRFPISTVTNKVTIRCAVTEKDSSTYIGVGSITLVNDIQKNNDFNLIINNGVQTFKYNEFGISPVSKSVNNPIVINDLSFTLFDPQNRVILDSKKLTDTDDINYQWEIPNTNTMLVFSDGTVKDNNYISTKPILSYGISDQYKISANRNNITLKLTYQGMAFVAQTNFTFIKQGQMGTNGTDYISKIQPVCIDSDLPYYPTIYLNYGSTKTYAFKGTNWGCTEASNLQFELKLFHNNVITDVTRTVKWSVLANKYTSSIFDNKLIEVDKDSGNKGIFKIVSDLSDRIKKISQNQAPACIIKAEVKYNGLYQYAYLPIVFSIGNWENDTNNQYQIDLQPYTGFNYAIYAPDGTRPVYDDANPHTLKVTQIIDKKEEDVTKYENSDYKLKYVWSTIGTTYFHQNEKDSIISDFRTTPEIKIIKSSQNTCIVKPFDNYGAEKADDALGRCITNNCVTNSVKCQVYREKDNAYVGTIIMPVHTMLNQYGNAKLNGWDGNSIDIDDEGGVILAPQVGAGRKDGDNGFTGILMGEVRLQDSNKVTSTGLFGFHNGKQSIFLDSDTGNATFGIAGEGQIKLIPNGTSTIANWNINNTFLSAGNKKAIGDKMKGAYLGSDGTFEFSSGYATEDEKNNSGATTYNYIRYSSKDGDQGRDLQIVGGTIQGGSIEISNTGNRNNTIFKANPQEIQFGNWHMNKTSENAEDSTNRDVFYYGNWRNSTVGFSGNPEVSKGLYFWAGWKNNEGIIQVNSGGVTIGHGSTFAVGNPYAGSNSQWDSNNTFQVYGNQIMVYGQTLESYIQSLMPEGEEGDEEGTEGEDEG